MIVFGKGCWFALDQMATSGASAVGLDQYYLEQARAWTSEVEELLFKETLTLLDSSLLFQL